MIIVHFILLHGGDPSNTSSTDEGSTPFHMTTHVRENKDLCV